MSIFFQKNTYAALAALSCSTGPLQPSRSSDAMEELLIIRNLLYRSSPVLGSGDRHLGNFQKKRHWHPFAQQPLSIRKTENPLLVLVVVATVLSRVFMVIGMGIERRAGGSGMPVHMAMGVLMGMLMGVDFITVLMFMAVAVGMLMHMQVPMLRNFFHGNLHRENRFPPNIFNFIIKSPLRYSTIFWEFRQSLASLSWSG
jgi:hypothetical protein